MPLHPPIRPPHPALPGRPMYLDIVERMAELPWAELDEDELQRLMALTLAHAREFAESLRIALGLYPGDATLQRLARDELWTRNLSFGSYARRGDHADFIDHFLGRARIAPDPELRERSAAYAAACRALDAPTRAMSVFSREEELSDVSPEILRAADWSAPGLDAFRFYLERKVELDAAPGRHREPSGIVIDDRLVPFYTARLASYRAIPGLFAMTH